MNESELFEHGYAVVIGIDENATPGAELPTVARDVRAINDVLLHPQRCAYDPQNVRLLVGSDSTCKNILDSLDWLREKVMADPLATAVFYYSGHGHVDGATGQYYLIPYEFQGLSRLDESAIKAETFAGKLAAVQAPRTLIILDCCHAEGMEAKSLDGSKAAFPIETTDMKNIPASEEEPLSKAAGELVDGTGRAILNSSTADQLSWLRKDGKMSLFTYHLIEGLTGHATPPDETVVLVADVIRWVQRNVQKSAEADGRPAQTPVIKMDSKGAFPIAQSIGGLGVAKGLDGTAPDPLAPLPLVTMSVEAAHIEDSSIAGRDVVNKEGGVHFGAGDVHIEGPVAGGDVHYGDNISVGDVGDNVLGVAIGRQSTVNAAQGKTPRENDINLDMMFTPLRASASAQDPALGEKVDALKAQVSLGSGADDDAVANLIFDITDAAPRTKKTIVELFAIPQISTAAGPATKFALGRLA